MTKVATLTVSNPPRDHVQRTTLRDGNPVG
jgi:hypothetical protein